MSDVDPDGVGPIVASGVSDYEWEVDSGGGFSAPTSTSGAVSILESQPAGTHAYQVRSVDAAGNVSSFSGTVAVVVDTTAPSAPGVPSGAPNPNNGSFTVSWTASSDPDVVDYELFENGGSLGFFAGTSTGLTQISGFYSYEAVARDSAGNLSASSGAGPSVEVDTSLPDTVGDLTVLTGPPGTPGSETSTTLTLTWAAPGDDGGVGTAVSYDVRRSASPITAGNFASATAVTGEPVPSPGSSSETMTVTGLSSSTAHFFAIKATDDVGNVGLVSNSPSGTTRVGIPQNLSAIANDGTIDLSWDPVSGAAGYLVRYGQNDGGPYDGTEASEGSSPINVLTTSITLNVPNNKQFYMVVAATRCRFRGWRTPRRRSPSRREP
ncbi:MAG: hypothetical protein HYY93_11560 [Planctomycetes bacterium]|nr:hypothetical protein [Planctomycetota bacterium]